MRKLAWFTAGFACSCLWGCFGPQNSLLPSALSFGALAGVALVLFLSARQRLSRRRLFAAARRVLALSLGGLIAAGWFSGWSLLFRAPADNMAGQTLPLTGTVTSYPKETSIGGRYMTISLDGGITAPDVMLYASHQWGSLLPGDRVSFTARLKPADLLYGDETTYYTGKGISLLGYCDDPPEHLGRSDHIRYWPARCANALKSSLTAAFDQVTAPLAIAITTGDKGGLSDELISALNRSGAAHTVVVSGMHISFLVAAVMALTRHRRRTALAFIPLLIFYALMAGGTPSAFRAVIMQSVFLAAPILKREHDAPSALSFALLLLLVCSPYSIGSVSLQLSFSSVAGILAVSAPLADWLARPARAFCQRRSSWSRRVVRHLCCAAAVSVSTSLGAMLFAGPLLCVYFRQCSLVFPLTNLLVLWAMSLFFLCVLSVGTLGLFLPSAAALLAPAAGVFGRYILWVVTTIGQWKFAALNTENFYYLLCLMAVYLFLLAGLLFRRDRLRLPIPIGCLILLLAASFALSRRPVFGPLTVTALDVGQGASTAILSDGYTCLVDCGGNSADNAGSIAADHFASMGIGKLDLLVLTHFDGDHYNGVRQLFARMDIDQVAIPDVETEYGRMEELLQLAEEEGAIVTYVTTQMEVALGQASLTLFPPLGRGTSNEEGLFVLASSQDFDVLITGDADSFVEKMLLKYYNIPDIELLMVGHHGSPSSTCREFLDELRPELAIISVGYNTYGHPADRVLALFSERNTSVYRTDTMGSVTIQVRSDGYAAQTQNG